MAPPSFPRLAPQCMAVATTGTALCLSIAVSWHRSPVLWEQVLGAALATLVTVGVHLLPALAQAHVYHLRRGARAGCLLGGGLLWLIGLSWLLYAHATFFLNVQAHAGQVRADAVAATAATLAPSPSPTPFQPPRGLTEIAQERARLIEEQGRLAGQPCVNACTHLQAKRAALAARLDALSVETGEVRRWQVERDQQEQQARRDQERRDAARDDAFMVGIATWLGASVASLNWAMALGMAIFVEGCTAVCWLLAAHSPEQPVPIAVGPVTPAERAVPAPVPDDDTSYEARLRRTWDALQAGDIDPTFRDIRKRLKCGSRTASAIYREIHRPAVPNS